MFPRGASNRFYPLEAPKKCENKKMSFSTLTWD